MRIGIGSFGLKPGLSGNRIPPELVKDLRELPRCKGEWLAEALALMALIAHVVLVALDYSLLPDLVPSHFGYDGLPDAYGGKSMVWILLGANIAQYLLMSVLVKFPGAYNFAVKITAENARRQFLLMRGMVVGLKALVCLMFCYLGAQTIQVALGHSAGLGFGIWIIMAALLGGLPLIFWLSYKWR